MLYIQERTKVSGGGFDAFTRAAAEEQVPLYHDLGLRLVAYWKTVHTQGYWPEVVCLWEIDDYRDFAKLGAQQFSGGPLGGRSRAWRAHLATLATESRGVLLSPSSGTPTLEQLRKQGKSWAICLHESATTLPNMKFEYIEHIQKLWRPVAERHGRWMLGTYAEIWHNKEAINIWALEGWDAIAKYQSKFGEDPDAATWNVVAKALRTDWDDRLLVALPFSPS
jgi:hypothetical protein